MSDYSADRRWEYEPRIVAIGGGTGLSTMLRGLKSYTHNLTAIVTVADDGGGSGVLRQDLGMPPPGDIRHCMEALANVEPVMGELLSYRFPKDSGSLAGQSFGNLILAALNGISGSFDQAVARMSQVLAITGRVLPVTTQNVRLAARFVPLVASYIGTSYLNGGSYKYAIFPVLFALAAIALRNQLHQKDPANDIYINLCLYCALAYIAVVKVFMMERFGMMFSIYICFLIAEMAELFPARLGRAAPSEQAAPAAPEAPAAPDGQKKRGLSTLAKRWCLILPFLIGALLVNQYYLSVGGHKARPYGTVFNEEWVQLQIDNYSFEPGNTGWKRWKFF